MFSAQVWSGTLSNKNKKDIKRVQRNALKIIEGSANTAYENALEMKLSTRRDKLCLTFSDFFWKVVSVVIGLPKAWLLEVGLNILQKQKPKLKDLQLQQSHTLQNFWIRILPSSKQ